MEKQGAIFHLLIYSLNVCNSHELGPGQSESQILPLGLQIDRACLPAELGWQCVSVSDLCLKPFHWIWLQQLHIEYEMESIFLSFGCFS